MSGLRGLACRVFVLGRFELEAYLKILLCCPRSYASASVIAGATTDVDLNGSAQKDDGTVNRDLGSWV